MGVMWRRLADLRVTDLTLYLLPIDALALTIHSYNFLFMVKALPMMFIEKYNTVHICKWHS